MKPKIDHAQTITDQILTLWDDCDDYERPWSKRRTNKDTLEKSKTTFTALPTNAHTGKPYSGINVLILWGSGYPCRWFATYKQWSEHLGCQVRKGESGTRIIVYKPKLDAAGNVVLDDNGEEIWYPRTYVVFNAAQVDGAAAEKLLADEMAETVVEAATMERLPAVDKLIAATGIKVKHGGDRAYYDVKTDAIKMPQFARFKDAISYYSVMFHEIGHATGAAKRLNRDAIAVRGASKTLRTKAEEELVAELSACFTLASLGLAATVREESVSYIRHWTQSMKEDKRFILRVASAAQKASNWILRTGEPEDDNDQD